MPKNNIRRLIDFFGINASITAMVIMVVFIGLGEKMAERFLPIYILALGGSTIVVGFLNAMDNLLSALYSLPGGWISDRLGHKKALIIFTLIAMFGYAIVIASPSWQAVLIGSIFFISWTAVSLPAVMSLVSQAVPKDKRAMGVTVHSFVRRIPMALGPILGGLLIGNYGMVKGVRIAFGAALGLAMISIIVQWFFIDRPPVKLSAKGGCDSGARPTIPGSNSLHSNCQNMESDEPQKAEVKSVKPAGGLFKNFNPALRNLLVSDILIRFAEQIPYAFVVVWVVNNIGLSAFHFGILTTVEMATAMLVYIPVAYLADRTSKKPFVIITFGFFTVFPLVLLFSRTFPVLIIAFIVRGLKEFGEPTRKALIMDLAPEDAKAITFGTYYLFRDVIVAMAALSSAFLWNISPQTNFLVASACGLVGTVWFALLGKDLKAQAPGVGDK
ncbi:MAG: MFS transporter [Candidatus Brocadiia bacterium]